MTYQRKLIAHRDPDGPGYRVDLPGGYTHKAGRYQVYQVANAWFAARHPGDPCCTSKHRFATKRAALEHLAELAYYPSKAQRVEAAHVVRAARQHLAAWTTAVEAFDQLPDITYENAVADLDAVIDRLQMAKRVLRGRATGSTSILRRET